MHPSSTAPLECVIEPVRMPGSGPGSPHGELSAGDQEGGPESEGKLRSPHSSPTKFCMTWQARPSVVLWGMRRSEELSVKSCMVGAPAYLGKDSSCQRLQ